MNSTDLKAILPLILLAATAIFDMMAIAIRRNHTFTAISTVVGFAAALGSIFIAAPLATRDVTALFRIDSEALFFTGLIVGGSIVVVLLCYGYFRHHEWDQPSEIYILIAIATLGAAVLASASHFASLFLGLEILSVALYGMIGYERRARASIEAALKYLVLAATSASFLLFGMALIYFELGTMDFRQMPLAISNHGYSSEALAVAATLMLAGIGYKLALVPFHTWAPDVYEGAPAPVTAFIATVSKGGAFAVLLRYFGRSGISENHMLPLVFTIVAVASMVGGNLLALYQTNVKRILAYSSIAHLGYLIVAFQAGRALGESAAAFYLVAYFVTTLGAFGVVTLFSTPGNDSDTLDNYKGLFWTRPGVAAAFTVMLLSLAGIPLTAGFLGKVYLVASGASSSLWLLIFTLVITSVIGLFYYLRVVAAVFSRPADTPGDIPPGEAGQPGLLRWTLACLTAVVIAIGCYPAPLLQLIRNMVSG